MNISAYKKFKTRTIHFGLVTTTLEFMEHRKGGHPKYVLIERNTDSKRIQVRATAESKTDLDILMEELKMLMFGMGDFLLTGYGFSNLPPVEVHKGIKIGRFKLRIKSKHLPQYGALVGRGYDSKVEGHAVKEVRKQIGDIVG
jgi:hypothetical protein